MCPLREDGIARLQSAAAPHDLSTCLRVLLVARYVPGTRPRCGRFRGPDHLWPCRLPLARWRPNPADKIARSGTAGLHPVRIRSLRGQGCAASVRSAWKRGEAEGNAQVMASPSRGIFPCAAIAGGCRGGGVGPRSRYEKDKARKQGRRGCSSGFISASGAGLPESRRPAARTMVSEGANE